MKPKTAYLALSILGAFLPYLKFVPWVAEHGLNGTLFVQELFVNRISAFFAMDVIVAAVRADQVCQSGESSARHPQMVASGGRYARRWRISWTAVVPLYAGVEVGGLGGQSVERECGSQPG